MKKVLLSIAALIMLVGCGSSSGTGESVTVCTIDSSYAGYDSSEQVYTATKDNVTKIATKSVLDLIDLETAEATIAELEPIFAQVNELPGIKVSYERIDDTKIYDISEIDLATADIDTLVQLGMLQLTGNENAKSISLKLSVQQMEQIGFSCKTK